MITRLTKDDPDWLEHVLEAVRFVGFAVVDDVLSPDLVARVRESLYTGLESIRTEMGDRLERAKERGVVRIPMQRDPCFFRFLELPEVLSVVDATVSSTAIMHLQNGFVHPPGGERDEAYFQQRFHQDFPRVLNGALLSINTFFALDPFTDETGATLVVPGSHQRPDAPSEGYMRRNAVPVEAEPGAMVVFDSTLWHAAGPNRSGRDRLAINHQFTRSYIKQQIDYVRALGDEAVLAQPPRTQQLLGWYTRVVTSLDDFYQPPESRLYRSGQG